MNVCTYLFYLRVCSTNHRLAYTCLGHCHMDWGLLASKDTRMYPASSYHRIQLDYQPEQKESRFLLFFQTRQARNASQCKGISWISDRTSEPSGKMYSLCLSPSKVPQSPQVLSQYWKGTSTSTLLFPSKRTTSWKSVLRTYRQTNSHNRSFSYQPCNSFHVHVYQ